MSQALFLILATLGLGAALGTVLARNLVHAALYLVAFFFLVACQFLLLEAEFLAAVQVLVYIGAVAILMMFGIMLTRNIQGDETTTTRWAWRVPAALASLGFLAVIVVGIGRESGLGDRRGWATIRARPAVGPDPLLGASPKGRAVNDMGRSVGSELMGRYALPFEVAGLLLTAALVGSIALATQDGDDDEPDARSGHSRRRGVGRRLARPKAPTSPEP